MNKTYLLLILFNTAAIISFSQQTKRSVLFDLVTEKSKVLNATEEIELFQPDNKRLSDQINKTVVDKKVLLLLKQTSLKLYKRSPSCITLVLPSSTDVPLKLKLIKEDISSVANAAYGTLNGNVVKEKGGVIEAIHYRGYINGNPSSIAAFSIFSNGDVMCLFSGAEGNFNLGKAGTKDGQYILYNSKNLKASLNFTCAVSELPVIEGESIIPPADLRTQTAPLLCKKVRLYWEGDYKLYSNNFSSDLTNTVNYLSGLFNQVAVMYLNEGVPIELSDLYIWTTPNGYNNSTSTTALSSFKSRWNSSGNNFKGDLAVLIDGAPTNNGGLAYLRNGLCNRSFAYGYADVYASYNEVPVYSWDVEVVTHEIGHLMGSNHTQWCGWNTGAGGTCGAVDDCYTTEAVGSCSTCGATTSTNPGAPAGFQGTVMSYCHLRSGIGINLANGFGPLPQNAIRTTVNNAACAVFANTWTGTYSTAWEDPANWSCGSIPNATTDVTIPGGLTNYPLVSSVAVCRKITQQPGTSVLVSTGFMLSVIGKTNW